MAGLRKSKKDVNRKSDPRHAPCLAYNQVQYAASSMSGRRLPDKFRPYERNRASGQRCRPEETVFSSPRCQTNEGLAKFEETACSRARLGNSMLKGIHLPSRDREGAVMLPNFAK